MSIPERRKKTKNSSIWEPKDMFVARVKHKYDGRFLLGRSTCMDLTVEQKETVTEQLYSALAQTPGSAYTAEA